jgi:hypothetical protein
MPPGIAAKHVPSDFTHGDTTVICDAMQGLAKLGLNKDGQGSGVAGAGCSRHGGMLGQAQQKSA